MNRTEIVALFERLYVPVIKEKIARELGNKIEECLSRGDIEKILFEALREFKVVCETKDNSNQIILTVKVE